MGLTDDMIQELEKYEDLKPLLRLHDLNKKVRDKNKDNQDKIDKL